MRPHYSAPKALSLEELAQQCDIEAAERRFWSKVDKRGPDDCWLWQAFWDVNGRPHFYMAGKQRCAARVSYLFSHGVLSPDLVVCHSCDVPRCVNPGHLFPGGHADNAADRHRKGRSRNRRTGKLGSDQPRYVAMPYPTRAQMLNAKLDKSGDCWIWMGARDKDGYGHLSGHERGRRYNRRAHRMAYELAFGPIPAGLAVCHRCDVPACCNPTHLFLGTNADNMRDRKAKGRKGRAGRHANHARGERVNTAKLKAADIPVIRARALAEPYMVIAQDYGVSVTSIATIAERKKWRHIPDPPGVAVGGRDTRYASRLTEAQQAAALDRYRAGGVTQAELGAAYGVSFATIQRILHRAGVYRGPGGRLRATGEP